MAILDNMSIYYENGQIVLGSFILVKLLAFLHVGSGKPKSHTVLNY
jgi:hypothetical protein